MKRYLCLLIIFFIANEASGQDITPQGPVTFCQGGSVVLKAPAGSAYQWYNNNTLLPGQILQTYTATTSGNYTVAFTASNIRDTTAGLDVTVNPNPVATINSTVNNVCAGTPVPFTANVTSGKLPFTYLWTFADGGTSASQNPTHAFTSLGCTTVPLNATLTVTDSTGCIGTISKSTTVLQSPDVQLQDANTFSAPFSNCDNAPTLANPNFTLTVKNISPSLSCITKYSLDWGDGNVLNNLTSASFPLTHTYTQLGAFNLIITATGSNGCSTSKTYVVANQRSPAGGLGTLGGTTGLCGPTDIKFVIDHWDINSPGTVFNLNFDDGTSVTYNYPLNPALTPDTVTHTYITSSCPKSTFTALLTVKNSCPTSAPYTAGNIQINTKPVAHFYTSQTPACIGKTIYFYDSSVLGSYGSSCSSNGLYSWDFGDGSAISTTKNTQHVYTTAGTYTVSLTISNPCGSSTTTKQVCIIPIPTPSFTLDTTTGCAPFTVQATNTSDTSTCSRAIFQWTLTYTSAFCGTVSSYSYAPGSNSSSTNPSFIFNNPGNYAISLKIISDCGGNLSFTKNVTVRKSPTLSLPADSSACGSVIYNARAIVPSCETSLIIYSWTFGGGNPSASNTSNPGPVSFVNTGQHAIVLSATNSCGTTTLSQQLTVNPIPDLIIPADTSYCAGSATGPFTFSSSLSGTTFTWTNSNTAIGLSNSGSGNIASFNATNNTPLPITATIRVTASKNGCSKQATFVITVNPKPATPTVTTPVNYCVGDSSVTLSASSTTGNTLLWYTTPTGEWETWLPLNQLLLQQVILTGM